MEQDDSKEEWSKPDDDLRHTRSPTPDAFAIGGLSLEDFRQNEWLRHLEAITHSPELAANKADGTQLEQTARKKFRRHQEREGDRAAIRNCQTVTDGSGRRGGGRDGWNRSLGDPFPFDGAELFGQIRPDNKRHPKRTTSNRATTPLQHLIGRIVDDGLAHIFLRELSTYMKARAFQDAGLVRHYALLVSEAGFDTETLQAVREVDDDLMLSSGDNKFTAELLTEFGYPTTVRDVENSKKRLARSLLEVGARIYRRSAQTKGSKE